MNVPRLLAGLVDALHGLVNVFWLIGFCFPPSLFPALRLVHSIFGIVVLVTLVSFRWKCPLTRIARWLRERADPAVSTTPYQPFITGWLKRVGLSIPESWVTAATLAGSAVMVVTLVQIEAGGAV